ncbi:MAG: 1-phosphofructokinase family hexose kinase [Ginsengibacter sp.]
MSKIITITFSPCIDKSTSIPELIPEKKLLCSSPKLEPGGGGINVARALKKLGEDAIAIFPSGGYTGKYFNHLMEAENISSKIIEIENETRENIIVLDESINSQYRFGMPGTELSEKEWKKCLLAVEEINDIGYIVASGSLPPGVPVNIYARLAEIAKQKKARLIVDTSGEALKEAAERGVYLLKPNLGELSFLAGKEKLEPGDIIKVSQQVIAKGMCEVIVISMGMAGAHFITKDIVEVIKAPQVNRQSTVGAGDSMVAGIVYFLCSGKSLPEAVQFGVACGTAATMNPGSELCKKEDAYALFNLIQNN